MKRAKSGMNLNLDANFARRATLVYYVATPTAAIVAVVP